VLHSPLTYPSSLPPLPPSLPAAYSASKHAAEAWSNSLRQEMRHFNIEVTVVNPSRHATRCALPPKDKLLASFRAAPAEVQADYGEEYVLEAAEEAYTGRQRFTWKVTLKRDRGEIRGRGEGIDQANRETDHLLSLPPLSGFLTSPFFLFFPFLHTFKQQTARKRRSRHALGRDGREIPTPVPRGHGRALCQYAFLGPPSQVCRSSRMEGIAASLVLFHETFL